MSDAYVVNVPTTACAGSTTGSADFRSGVLARLGRFGVWLGRPWVYRRGVLGQSGDDRAHERLYKVAWVGACVLYDRAALLACGGFDFWPELPPEHVGEDVVAQLRVMERFGVPAHRYIDFATLRGDPSDGLPGVRGVGEKTARALVSAYPNLEAMLERVRVCSADDLTGECATRARYQDHPAHPRVGVLEHVQHADEVPTRR